MSVSSRVLRSSGFLLAIQVIQRSLGIISTLILARLLTPEHFGIVALVAIALQFFEVLADAGNANYIIQKTQVTDSDINTAWTLDLIIKITIAVLIIAVAPFLATYFEAPRLTLALSIASLALPIRALRNPGLMLLAKQMDYRPVFILNIWQKAISFITVVSIALVHPSYWAIIVGNLVAVIVLAFGSYRVHSHRPRLTLAHVHDQWHFSKWLILRGVVGFTRSQIDNLIISKLFGPSRLGGYHLIRELSTFPAVSVIIPGSEPLQAAIADGRTNPAVLAYRVRLSLLMMTTLVLPISGFMAAYPELIVRVLLGPDWGDFSHLLAAFSLFFFTFCLFALISDAFLAIGKVKALFIFDVVSTLIIIATLLSLPDPTLADMAWTRGWLAVLTTVVLLVMLERRTAFNLGRLLLLCLPAGIATTAGLVSTALLTPWMPSTAWMTLLMLGSIFSVVSFLVWLLIGACYLHRFEEYKHLADMVIPHIRQFAAKVARLR